ncbi:hypothetical protein DFR56_11155 [Pseudogracilibacillus auburnensis]|uniref:Uncharacterized protein n=1 Tax=Pseudogracilibacillus auburnensis TaxID=1494959 RepID=A0A2V3VTS5_9BACI|nr:hypothetical protein DFR56_11155 [Pseudogracilibacillus auburnensis]
MGVGVLGTAENFEKAREFRVSMRKNPHIEGVLILIFWNIDCEGGSFP